MSSYPENKKVCTQHTTATFNQTADLLNAIQALSQLSYTPMLRPQLQKFLKHICLGLFSVLFSSIGGCARKTQMRCFWLEMWSEMWSEVSTP